MRIINISHLFKTPVISSVDTLSQISRKKRKRNRGKAQKANCDNASALPSEQPIKYQSVSNQSVENTKKRRRRRKPASEKSDIDPNRPVVKSKPQKNAQEKSRICDSNKVKPAENVKQEITELKNSLLILSSKKDMLERKLKELQEENDRLAKNNDDLKDELQEMTEEALELSVEKQRLLGKIGILKKQLLNKPKWA